MILALIVLVAFIATLGSLSASSYVVPPANLKSSRYARWAHYPWIWNHNSHSNTADITELVEVSLID